ncbi:MAG: response regulator transcription factor, partial [Bacteroidota bacterium]
AIEGFNLNVLDYLLKPVSFERFFQGVSKAYEYANHQEKASEDFIWIKNGGRMEKIDLKEIQYLESMQNYVLLHKSKQKITLHNTLKNVLTYLSEDRFLKVHKSYVINLAFLKSVEGNMLEVGDKIVPIGRSMKEQVLERILNNRLIKK